MNDKSNLTTPIDMVLTILFTSIKRGENLHIVLSRTAFALGSFMGNMPDDLPKHHEKQIMDGIKAIQAALEKKDRALAGEEALKLRDVMLEYKYGKPSSVTRVH